MCGQGQHILVDVGAQSMGAKGPRAGRCGTAQGRGRGGAPWGAPSREMGRRLREWEEMRGQGHQIVVVGAHRKGTKGVWAGRCGTAQRRGRGGPPWGARCRETGRLRSRRAAAAQPQDEAAGGPHNPASQIRGSTDSIALALIRGTV